MPKNMLLVYPKIPEDTYWSFYHALPIIGRKTVLPPLGLITIADMLGEHNIKLVDENVETLTDLHLEWADMVFTSSMVAQAKSLDDIVSRAKGFNLPVAAGGPYPTQFYDRIKNVDYFVLGEAESGVLEQFLADLEIGEAKKAYVRFVMRKKASEKAIDELEFRRMKDFFGENGDIKLISQRPEMVLSPVPRYDILRMRDYSSMALQLSRGCPFSCDFCNESALFGHVPRLKSKTQFIEELSALYELGYRGSIFVVDDNFIGNIGMAKEVLAAIQEFQQSRGYPFSLYTEASINLSHDEQLMAAMRDAGFSMVFVGIESPDATTLKTAGKHMNARTDLLEGVRTIQRYGMEVSAGFIIGMDMEPADVCDRTFEFLQEAGIPTAMVGLLTPILGSELYARYQSEGRILTDEVFGNNTHLFSLNYVPDRGRDPAAIVSSYKSLLARLYDSSGKNYFARCKRLLNNLGPAPNFSRGASVDGFKKFGRSLLKQSFTAYGKEYIKFLWHSYRQKREFFPEAVRLAIFGHHFIKLTQDYLRE